MTCLNEVAAGLRSHVPDRRTTAADRHDIEAKLLQRLAWDVVRIYPDCSLFETGIVFRVIAYCLVIWIRMIVIDFVW